MITYESMQGRLQTMHIKGHYERRSTTWTNVCKTKGNQRFMKRIIWNIRGTGRKGF